MKQEWIFREEPQAELIDAIASSLGFGYLASKILILKQIDDYSKARAFFKPNLNDLHDPFLMKDMAKAVERIAIAIENGEKILVFGDYDVDGTTAVALMYLYLKKIVDKKYLDYYIPDRNLEGYGVSIDGINYAKKNGFSLIISLDCGIKSIDKVDYANSLGVDFIICDHHLPGETIPNAVAVLDPKRQDCAYPFKELSGCGVGFKLCQALNTIYQLPEKDLFELTDLLAISIAADIVSITGENRVLAKQGLKILRRTKKIGLKLLVPAEKLENFDISNVVFEIAPKINAAGRISHGKCAVELMISEDPTEAQHIVENIINLNSSRRELDGYSTVQALEQIIETNQISNFSTVVYNGGWNKGVIGIVASRLTETYYRPTLVFTDGNEGELVASARSVADFDVHHALDKCADLFLKFGGHRAAAGLSMEKENFSTFKDRFEKIVSEQIKSHQKSPCLHIDAVIKLNDLNKDFLDFHSRLAPFGPGNMKPVLMVKDLKIDDAIFYIGKDKSHLKFKLNTRNDVRMIDCLGFKLGHLYDDFKTKHFDMVFSIDENYWRGNKSHVLNIKDVQFKS